MQESSTLDGLISLALDHSLTWAARLSAAALLSRLVASGGPAAEAAIKMGAFVVLIEIMDRDT